jgi:hypothetical protein
MHHTTTGVLSKSSTFIAISFSSASTSIREYKYWRVLYGRRKLRVLAPCMSASVFGLQGDNQDDVRLCPGGLIDARKRAFAIWSDYSTGEIVEVLVVSPHYGEIVSSCSSAYTLVQTCRAFTRTRIGRFSTSRNVLSSSHRKLSSSIASKSNLNNSLDSMSRISAHARC